MEGNLGNIYETV